MRYKLQKFVKTFDGGSPIGEGDEYEWQNIYGRFDSSSQAISFAKTLTTLDVRVFDTQYNKPVWSND